MNSEEPVESAQQNDQVSTQGHDLPEQGKVGRSTMPRQVSVLDWIYQWQPMGYRVVVNLPFTGNDADFLFAIRNGPFIPRWEKRYVPRNRDEFQPTCTAAQCSNVTTYYAWNNTRAVFPFYIRETPQARDPSVVISQFDAPPMLSTLAQSFRRWRGDMQYRIRLVAGFVTQGYLVVTTMKNKFFPIGKYNEYWHVPKMTQQDISYREGMQNSYILSDTSMIRHVEATMLYEYPLPYYDQYEWLARRVNPFPYWCRSVDKVSGNCQVKPTGARFDQIPHGDNYLVVGLRGQLATGQTGSQLAFELEYRAMEGFQFADPGFPPTDTSKSLNDMLRDIRKSGDETTKKFMQVKAVPNPFKVKSNGWDHIETIPEKTLSETSTTPETYTSRYIDEEGKIRSIPVVRSEQLKAAGSGSQQQRSSAQASRQAYSRHRTHRDTDGVVSDHEDDQRDTPDRVTSWLGSSSRY